MSKSREPNHNRGIADSDIDDELREFWQQIDLAQQEPSEGLRQAFYRQLSAQQSKPRSGLSASLTNWLAWLRQPALAAAFSLVLGLVIGSQWLGGADDGDTQSQLKTLESQVAGLNTTLALNLMQNAAIGDRLSGIELAAGLQSQQVDQALLTRIRDDGSQSVRSAALSALGPRINQSEIWQELEQLLVTTDSELVQLALVDLIFRFGDEAQLDHLTEVTNDARLLPDINQYASDKIQQVSI